MRSENLGIIASVCASLYASTPPSAMAEWQEATLPQHSIFAASTSEPQSEMRHGELSDLQSPKVKLLPILDTPHEILVVTNPTLDPANSASVAQQVSNRVQDATRFIFINQKPTEFDLSRENKGEESALMARAASTLTEHMLNLLKESTSSVHIVCGGLGNTAVIGALERTQRLLAESNPEEWRRALKRIHLVILGSFPIPESITPLLKDLGSFFEIHLKNGDLQINGLTLSDTILKERLLPLITPTMLLTSGELEVKLTAQVPEEDKRTPAQQEVDQTISKTRQSRAQDALLRTIQEIEHLANQEKERRLASEIVNVIAQLEMLKYTAEQLNREYDDALKDLRALVQKQRILEQIIDELMRVNNVNEVRLAELKDSVRNAVSELIRYVLTRPRQPNPAELHVDVPELNLDHPRVYPNGVEEAQKKLDDDRDGIPNLVESKILEHFKPILALNAEGHRLPVSITTFRNRSNQVGGDNDFDGYLKVNDWRSETDPNDAVWYGRVTQARQESGISNRYVVQYYMVFLANTVTSSKTGTNALNFLDFITTPLLGALNIYIDDERGYIPPIGGHEGDITCVEFEVEVPSIIKMSDARIIHGTFHNHGRQFFIDGAGLDYEEFRPIVYAEAGTQEFLPKLGPAHREGFPREAASNQFKNDGFDSEDYVLAEHWGNKKISNLPVFNVGEVEMSKNGFPILRDGSIHRVDISSRPKSSEEEKRSQESKFLLEYPGQWGSSLYYVKVTVKVPFTDWEATIFEKKFDSPRGPVFNSFNEGKRDTTHEIIGKMWARSFNYDGQNPRADARIIGKVEQTTNAEEVILKWPEIPYALAYLVTVKDQKGNEFLFIPGWDNEMKLTIRDETDAPNWEKDSKSVIEEKVRAEFSRATLFRHNKSTGRRLDHTYTYSVDVIWSQGLRRLDMK